MAPKKSKAASGELQRGDQGEKFQTLEVVNKPSRKEKTVERASGMIVADKLNKGVKVPQEPEKVKNMQKSAGSKHIQKETDEGIKIVQALMEFPDPLTIGQLKKLAQVLAAVESGITPEEQQQLMTEELQNFAARLNTAIQLKEKLTEESSAPEIDQVTQVVEKIKSSLPIALQVLEQKKQNIADYLKHNEEEVKLQAAEGIKQRTEKLMSVAAEAATQKKLANEQLQIQEELRKKKEQADRFEARQLEIQVRTRQQNIDKFKELVPYQNELKTIMEKQYNLEESGAKGQTLAPVAKDTQTALELFVQKCREKNGALFRNVTQIQSQKFSSNAVKNKAIVDAINESLEIYSHPSTQKNNPKIYSSVQAVLEEMNREQMQNQVGRALELREIVNQNPVASSIGSQQQTVGADAGTFTQNQLPAQAVIPIPVVANKSVEKDSLQNMLSITMDQQKQLQKQNQGKGKGKKPTDAQQMAEEIVQKVINAIQDAQQAKQKIEEVKEPQHQDGNAAGALANNSIATRTVDLNKHNVSIFDVVQLNATGQLIDKVSEKSGLTEAQHQLLLENVQEPGFILQNMAEQQQAEKSQAGERSQESAKYPELSRIQSQHNQSNRSIQYPRRQEVDDLFGRNVDEYVGDVLQELNDINNYNGFFNQRDLDIYFPDWQDQLDQESDGSGFIPPLESRSSGISSIRSGVSSNGSGARSSGRESEWESVSSSNGLGISSIRGSGVSSNGSGWGQFPSVSLSSYARFVADAAIQCSQIAGDIDGGLLSKYKKQTQIFTTKIVKKEPVQFTIAPGSAFKIRSCC